jgi:hypothetical protein
MEDEKMWCPHARAVWLPADKEDGAEDLLVTHNRVGGHADKLDAVRGYGYCSCVSSDCMAWRWYDPEDEDKSDDRRGYCGLSGPVHHAK